LPKPPKIDRKDWRNLPSEQWNVRSFHVFFADMNAELFGATDYVPLRNWAFEQGVIKRAITEHGAVALRRAFDEAFRTYRPTREYPILTAGFAVAYRINSVLPRIKAEMAAEKAEVDGAPDYSEVAAWL